MLPSPSGCWLDPRGYSFSRPQCVHCYYSPVTRNLPWEDLVDRLRRFCFHPLRYPNYGVLTSTPAGLSPAEHASLHWTHNRTCGSPAYGSPVVGFHIGSVSPARKGSATGDPPMRSEGALAMCSLDAVASADTRRSVQIEPSARHLSGFRASAACLALSGTDQTLIGSIQSSRLQLPASLPSGWFCFPPFSPRIAAAVL